MTATERVFAAPREWARVHPVSPLLGGWAVIAGFGGWWLHNQVPGGEDESFEFADRLGWIVVLAVAVAAIVIGFSYLSWAFHTYRITDEAVEQRKGLLFRQQKQARLDRVQAVDVVQSLVGRVLGFAFIKVEVAGGAGSGIELKYLRLADAEALRNEVLALAAGARMPARDAAAGAPVTDADAGSRGHFHLAPAPGSARVAVAAAPERPLLAVPIPRLLGSILLSVGTITSLAVGLLFLVGSVAAGVFIPEVDIGAAFFGGGFLGIATGVFGVISTTLATLNRGMNFRLGVAADGVRIAHGLLETRRQTIPPGRVQAVRLRQNLLWRGRDWWQITVNVAGYQDNHEAVSTLLPVGPRSEALTALWTVLPDLGDPDPVGVVSTAMSGTGAEGGFTASPRTARWLDPFQWAHRGVRATDTALFIRSGRWTRELVVVPHERTQSLALHQGPWQRALDLASVAVHSTKGPVRPVASHLAVPDALALVEDQAVRARQRRAAAGPERWLAAMGVEAHDPR